LFVHNKEQCRWWEEIHTWQLSLLGERLGLNVKGLNLKEYDETGWASMIEGNLID